MRFEASIGDRDIAPPRPDRSTSRSNPTRLSRNPTAFASALAISQPISSTTRKPRSFGTNVAIIAHAWPSPSVIWEPTTALLRFSLVGIVSQPASPGNLKWWHERVTGVAVPAPAVQSGITGGDR